MKIKLLTAVFLTAVCMCVKAQSLPTITNPGSISKVMAARGDTGITQKDFLRFKFPGREKTVEDSIAGVQLKKLSYRLAKLKMYSLALRYYYEGWLVGQGGKKRKNIPKNVSEDWLSNADTTDAQYVPTIADGGKHKARRIRLYFKEIKERFDDGKEAVAYALLIHVKQPVPRSRSSYTHINNVGHTFITMLKYNEDKTTTSNTFGFYPYKDHFLSATPVYPGSTAEFRNDGEHEWDETVGCMISREKFDQILRMVKRYSHRRYNLNKNNCSDFGLCVAGVAGIDIKDTKGSWPLGHGNTPASIGQSILEGRMRIIDSIATPFLFICNNTVDAE